MKKSEELKVHRELLGTAQKRVRAAKHALRKQQAIVRFHEKKIEELEPCRLCGGTGVTEGCMCDKEVFLGEGYGMSPEEHMREFHPCPECGKR